MSASTFSAATLSEWLVSARPDEKARAAAATCVLDWAGCALGGSTHPAARTLDTAMSELLGRGEGCTVIGLPSTAGPVVACWVNGAASHVLDYDDVNVPMIGHPAVVVVTAALAAAEQTGASGEDLLAAVVTGYAVAEILGREVNPRHYEAGSHATSTIGAIAAAAAVARLRSFDAEQTARALSLAASQASGVRAMFGSSGKSFHAGRAAVAGLTACQLAGAGLEVPGDCLTGTAGFLSVATGGQTTGFGHELPDDVGHAVLTNAFKSHAACGATHCLIDAVAGLVAEHRVDSRDVERLEAAVHSLAVRAAGDPSPTTGLEAKFSLRHTAAMALVHPTLDPQLFRDDVCMAEPFLTLRERVEIEVDPSFEYAEAMPARVTLHLRGGTVLERTVELPRGRPSNPKSPDEHAAKFLNLARPVLGDAGARAAADALAALPTLTDCRQLGQVLRP